MAAEGEHLVGVGSDGREWRGCGGSAGFALGQGTDGGVDRLLGPALEGGLKGGAGSKGDLK